MNKRIIKIIALELLILAFILLYFPCVFSKAPLYLTNSRAISGIEKLLPKTTSFRFIDLGCGCGHVIYRLAKAFPNGQFVGVELSPILWFVSRILNIFNRNVRIKLSSIFSQDLSKFDYVYIFLSPVGNKMLLEKLKTTKGLIISNSFEIDSLDLVAKIEGIQPLFVYGSRMRSDIIDADEKASGCKLENEHGQQLDTPVLQCLSAKRPDPAGNLSPFRLY